MKKKLVFLTGAGVSAESGLETFRASDGLWSKHRIEDVCTPEALQRNPKLVLDFYNARRAQLKSVEPNSGHYRVAQLENFFDVNVVTQNVDDLHERAGSSKVLHLHGELLKCTSTLDSSYVEEIKDDLTVGDKCPKGGQLRPYIVFFGEAVPMMDLAVDVVSQADIVVVAGTSLNVYPAAGLINCSKTDSYKFLIDPADFNIRLKNLKHIKDKFSSGMDLLYNELTTYYL